MTRPGLINMELFFLDAMSCRLSAKNSCPSRKRMRRSPEKKKGFWTGAATAQHTVHGGAWGGRRRKLCGREEGEGRNCGWAPSGKPLHCISPETRGPLASARRLASKRRRPALLPFMAVGSGASCLWMGRTRRGWLGETPSPQRGSPTCGPRSSRKRER